MADPVPRVDFEAVFNAAPGSYLLLRPDLTIAAVDDAYLAATMTARDAIVGRPLFDVFPDDPADPAASGVRNLHASLLRALESRRPDRMPLQRYPIRLPAEAGGGFELRYWSPLNTPVLGPDGEVEVIAGTTPDVTDRQRAEDRERFLLALDDAVRALSDPAQITATYARLLGEHMRVDRCAYADVEADSDTFNLIGDYTRGAPSIVGRYRFADFGDECLRLMRSGKPYVV